MAYNILEKWPFTSCQNLNLSWILNGMQQLAKAVEDVSGSIQSAINAARSAQSSATAAAASAAAAQQNAAQAQQTAAGAQETAQQALQTAAGAQETAQQALQTASGIIGMPAVTSAQAGYFARVSSSGVWIAEAVPSAESNSFGGGS